MSENNTQGRTFDMSTIRQCYVDKDRFRIEHYAFVKDCPFDDMVTSSAPYFHFQILKPKDEEQRQGAIDYFQKNNKLFVAWVNFPHILLYIGATKDVYIRSSRCEEVKKEDLEKVLNDAELWYRFYGVAAEE